MKQKHSFYQNLLIVLVFFYIGIGQAQFFEFSEDSVLTVAQGPEAACSADFNGDQVPDLAVAIRNGVVGDHVAIFLNGGAGVFPAEPDSTYPVAYYPNGISNGDFNNDQVTDLALSIAEDSLVWLLFGNGDGTFGDVDSIQVPSKCRTIVVTDVNNDQEKDIVVPTENMRIYIFRGNGNGTFADAMEYASGGSARSIDAFDMNNDNWVDLLVGKGNASNLSLLLNDGTGEFPNIKSVHTYRPPWYVRACDLNGDEYPDFVAGSGSWDFDNIITVLGDSAGNYTIADTTSSIYYVAHISVADFDGDGLIDVLSGDRNGVLIAKGAGDGTFVGSDTIIFQEYYYSRSTIPVDLDGNDSDDIIIARDEGVNVFYNNTIAAAIPQIINTPVSFDLHQNYPNPFNPLTTIRYQLAQPENVKLSVFNLLGQKIATIVNAQQPVGTYTVKFDGRALASGVYFYQITTSLGKQIRKMHIVK